jgi:MFS family permease
MKKSLQKFLALSKEKKSMLALFWIYEFASTSVSIFINVYFFLKTGSLWLLALFALFRYIGGILGFTGLGYIIAQKQYSMKWNYVRSFILYFLGFIWLAFTPHTALYLLLFSFINGTAMGLFWLGNHSYEMIFTKNEGGDRDFYSSMVQGGTKVIQILSPLIGTVLVLVSEKIFGIESLSLLFLFLPLVYLTSLPFLFNLPHFIPKKITREEINSFLGKGVRSKIKWYYVLACGEEIRNVIVTFFSILAFKNIINIGSWHTFTGIISLFLILILANRRYEGNRIKIMFYSMLGFLIAFGFLFFSDVSIYFFIIYSLIIIILGPLYRVSQHTLDLRSMDFLASNRSSFYTGLLYREIFLYIGRFGALGGMIITALLIKNDLLLAKIGIIVSAFLLILNWKVAKEMVKDNILKNALKNRQ